jgi:hypothetical protein
LLDRLHTLNNPRRVTYEMVGRELVSAGHKKTLLRTLTRDLSRQFRGDKPVEARVVEVYVGLLFADDLVRRRAETDACLSLHALAFPAAVGADAAAAFDPAFDPAVADPDADAGTRADPGGAADSPDGATAGIRDEAVAACIADLRQQLTEARTRASLASALLVVAHAEISRLRGKRRGFDWFLPAAGTPANPPGGAPATLPLRRPTPLRRMRFVAGNPIPDQRGA